MLSSITTILAFSAALAQAIPSEEEAQEHRAFGSPRFSLPAVHNPHFVRNGTASLLKAYRKYGLTPAGNLPPAAANALSKRQDSDTTASPGDGGLEYLIPVKVGGQLVNLDLDTGSADLWVFSSDLPEDQRQGHNYFDPSKSSTYKPLQGYSWNIGYQDGSGATGVVGTDTVVVGDTTVHNQAVELATQVSSEFLSDSSDGLIGLAFSSVNTVQPKQQKTFFENAQSSLESPLFAAYLPFNSTGAYDFGYTDSSKYHGRITYTAVDTSNGLWEYPSTSYKVGSRTFQAPGATAISDTGTTLLLMINDAVINYYNHVQGAYYDDNALGYVFPCNSYLPPLHVAIGPTAYATIPSSVLSFEEVGYGYCFGSLQSVGNGTQSIFGDIFFNANYAVFSADGPKFGFAPYKS